MYAYKKAGLTQNTHNIAHNNILIRVMIDTLSYIKSVATHEQVE